MDSAFIRFGHGYETGSYGRCEAFDGFTVLSNPLGGFDKDGRDSRVFFRKDGNGTDYGSHMLQLAELSDSIGRDLYILVHHGGGREVLRVSQFYDGGVLREHILAMPERAQYALLYTIWKTASYARREAQLQTRQEWAQAYVDGRIKKRRASGSRPARVEIVQAGEA